MIRGDVLDDQGVDSVFFDIAGASFTIPPVNVDGAVVLWSFTLQTAGLAGDLLTISVTAKDLDGNYGGPTTRLLSIQ